MEERDCVVPENIHIPSPQRRALLLETPTPSEFPFHGVLVTPCYSLEFPWFSILIGNPLERIFASKVLLHYTVMWNLIVSDIKWGGVHPFLCSGSFPVREWMSNLRPPPHCFTNEVFFTPQASQRPFIINLPFFVVTSVRSFVEVLFYIWYNIIFFGLCNIYKRYFMAWE